MKRLKVSSVLKVASVCVVEYITNLVFSLLQMQLFTCVLTHPFKFLSHLQYRKVLKQKLQCSL